MTYLSDFFLLDLYLTCGLLNRSSHDPVRVLYDQKKDQEGILKKASKRCSQQGLKPETLLLSGMTGEQIVEAAKAQGCDLIVVGSRQLSLMGTLAQGSVSDYVMRHAPCDVLIAR